MSTTKIAFVGYSFQRRAVADTLVPELKFDSVRSLSTDTAKTGDWLPDEIADWKSAVLTDVVSLLEHHETRELVLAQEGEIARSVGLCFETFSIPDRGVPASVELARALWSRLAKKVREVEVLEFIAALASDVRA